MLASASFRVRRTGDRPVVGILFGFHMFGTGRIYDFIDSLTCGIQAGTRDRDCSLLLSCGISILTPEKIRPAWPVPSTEADFVPVGPWNTDGLIVVHPLCSPERTQFIHELKASGFPIVFVGSAEGGPAIGIDNEGGIRKSLVHLAHHGHKRIAFIGGFPDDEHGDSGARQRAFLRCSSELEIQTDPGLIAYGYHNIVDGRHAMRKILDSKIPFTAVVASNDESALGAMEVLAEAGLDVPRDVAIIGFDNRLGVAHEFPALTTVHHPVFERGYRSAELLLDILDGKRERDDVVIDGPTRLVTRHSCGCTLRDIVTREADESAVSSRGVLDTQTRLTHTAMDAVLEKTLQAEPAEVYELSGQLAQALVTSLTTGRETDFVCAFQAVLTRTEQMQRDVSVWNVAIDALEKSPDLLSLPECVEGAKALAYRLLTNARARIAKRKQHNLHNRHFAFEMKGHLVARLVAARHETEILGILGEDAPKLGIRRCAIVLFEPDGDDPVAWSLMRTSTEAQAAPVRFRSRNFSPTEFSLSTDGAVHLALVPLAINSDLSGYMVLDCDDLSACTSIVHAVHTALKSCQTIELRRAAEEANKMKSRFLSAVGHELRTPLNFIVTASEFLELEKTNIDSAYSHNLAHIRASAQQVEGLVRDVLDLTRDDVGQLRLTCEAVDLATILRPVAALGEQLARAKGLGWRIEIQTDLPSAWADRARVRQIALNLITNAVKFTDRGDVTLHVEYDDPRLVISVQDSGVGVPPQERAAIFEEFQQSSRTAGRGGGFGLGLAICKRLVDMHFGKIDVVSTDDENSGSTFFFSLPVLKTGIPALTQTVGRDRTVLLIDDNSAETQDLRQRLTQHGSSVQQFDLADVSKLLDALANEPSAIVLLRNDAPATYTSKLYEIFTAHPETDDVTVLFYSPVKEATTPLKLEYLTQPIDSLELLSAIKRRGVNSDTTTKTVLVVEDDPRLLEMHVRIVQTLSQSLRVLTAHNGKQAIAIIKKEQPHLVLLDLIMPEMGGFEVLDAMQQCETTRDIPVIVVSGQTLADEDMSRLNPSVTTVLTKGVFTIEETQTQIQRTLDDAGHISEAHNVVRKTMGFVHKNYFKPIARSEIAAYLGVSEGHLTRCFRQTLHVSPMTYVMRYRVKRAKTLLSSGNTTLAKIAAATGFPNEFYFSHVFRRQTGVAPSTFRKQQRAS